MMPSYDNLWFTLLFVRRVTLLMSDEDVQKLAWVFVNATRYGGTIPDELYELVDEAIAHDRSPVFPREYLMEGFRTLTEMPRELFVSSAQSDQGFWGWKQANTHVLLPVLNRCFPRMKYVYVYRNCLHVGFNGNYNQLKYLWGNIFLEGEVKDQPSHLIRYWLTSHKRMLGMQHSMPGRLYMLDYDKLCREPERELELLSEFLGLDAMAEKISTLRELVPPLETPHPIDPAELANLGEELLADLRALGQLNGN